ncbi:hypothetical protein APHAL10511_004514 [Amanita phalloides]|nr:hypothetical protein APHAL10511_004514 [Amanita phalloides]
MRLPESLLQEIKVTDAGKRDRRRPYASRKEMRKQQRLDRKMRKGQFYGAKKRPAREEQSESPQRKRAKQEGYQPDNKTSTTSMPSKLHEKTTPNSGDSNKIIRPAHVPKAKSRAEEEEEAYIAHLESKLGYSSRSKKKRRSEDDGLSDLLDFADSVLVGDGPAGSSSSKPASEVEGRDDNDVSDEGSEGSGEFNSSEDNEDDTAAIEGTGDEGRLEFNEEEWSGIDDSIHNHSERSLALAQPNAEPSTAGMIRYVSPQLRTHQSPELDIKLTKRLKGLLNRMSEQNLATILDGIEEIYRAYGRHDVTSTLTRLIINGITSHSSLLDSFVVLHAAFVSSLHRLNGVEFAAFFVQSAISDYDRHYAAARAQDVDTPGNIGKECSNLIVLLSELYNFQVVSAVLIYDVIRSLLHDELTEFNVELLLKLLRNSGQRLRQDDPSALKDIITIVQSKFSAKEGNLSSRTRFMLETLVNLKNNKQRNATQHQGSGAVAMMEKFLTGLGKKRYLHARDALRVSLDDLRNAESKGKWWLVGAAWTGNPLVDKRTDMHTADDFVQDNAGEELLKLAKNQGMNTDIRRNVFLVIMSSDDYVDACERLSQLKLSGVQQREIVRVLLHCCGNEKTYNPYYTLVCHHLCQTTRAYQITLQYCLWDFLRDLGETKVGGAEIMKNVQEDDDRFGLKSISKVRLRNLARAYGWWIAKDSVTIMILKPVDFLALKSQGREFLQDLLINIFLSSQMTSPLISSDTRNLSTTRNRAAVEEIFIKATRVEELAMGLVYIMTDIFRDFSSQDEELTKLVRWAIGVAKVTLRTELDIVPTI